MKTLILALLMGITFTGEANASPVTYDFTGTVSLTADGPDGSTPEREVGGIRAGDAVSGSFTLEPPAAGHGPFTFDGAPSDLRLIVGGFYAFGSDPERASEGLRTWDYPDGSFQGMAFQEYGNSTSSALPPPNCLQVIFDGYRGPAFDGAVPPVLEYTDFAELIFAFGYQGSNYPVGYEIVGSIDTLSPRGEAVPEPASVILFAPAAARILRRRRLLRRA